MDLFNIGTLELIFLIGIAIIMVGPVRAAEMASEIGRLVARARRAINSITDDLREQAQEDTKPLRSARGSIRDLETELRRPLDESPARLNSGRGEPSTDVTSTDDTDSADANSTPEQR